MTEVDREVGQGRELIASTQPDEARYANAMKLAMEEWAGNLDWSRRLEGYITPMGVPLDRVVVNAFRKIRRYDFLPPEHAMEEGFNGPVPIGFGQTNSKPSVIATMLHILHPNPGNQILDVGAGSAWTTALLASMVGKRGRVIGTEVIPELVHFGNANLAKYSLQHASVVHTPEALGCAVNGPYNRILVSARLREDWLPELEDQLSRLGGVMVAPVCSVESFEAGGFTQNVISVTRHGSKFTRKVIWEGLGFVPIIRPRIQ